MIEAHHLAEALELAIIAHREDEKAVLHRQHFVGRDIHMGIAHLNRRIAGNQIVEVLVAEYGNLRVEQRHVDMLALAGCFRMAQGGLYRDHRIQPGEDVGDRDAHLLRLAAGLAGDRHQAADALDDEIVAGSWRIRPVLPETGDRAIDKARVDRLEAVIVEPVFLQSADLEILDQHIGRRDQLAHRLRALRRGEIHGDRALAAIGGMVIGGRQVLAVMAHDEGRTPFAGVVTAVGVLDLDDVRAEIGEHLPAPGPGEDAGKFNHAYALERRFGHGCCRLP